jgi:GT2 family glycosyltransferase
MDHSLDIVLTAAQGPTRLAESRRVAQHGVLLVSQASQPMNGNAQRHKATSVSPTPVEIAWSLDLEAVAIPSVSIVIPVFNGPELIKACLSALSHTLPRSYNVEIVVVDDASSAETVAAIHHAASLDPRVRIVSNGENVGFIDSCNRGAEASRSDILVLLNSDTVPRPGWLETLLTTFRTQPDAGAVGGKLLFPDGTLQEAGCIVFADGSAANAGRGHPAPDAPLFNFVREVDYCSGAMLATPRDLFRKVGGFDTRYRPGYYEDTDYCFQLRQRGYRVFYQPDSVIVHKEGGSAGTDLSRGMKRYQVNNQQKFVDKWKSVIARHPLPPSDYDLATWTSLLTFRPSWHV